MPARTLPRIETVALRDFSGGLNLRDSPTQVAPNECSDAMNGTLDERGGVAKRLGFEKDGAMSPLGAGNTQTGYYSSALGKLFVQAGAQLYRRDSAGTYVSVKTFTTTARCAMVDFNGKLVAVHSVDGVFDYDGVTFASRNTTVKGTCIGAWQNKVWVGGDPSNPTRIWWSNAGSSATWTTASDFNEIRDKDAAKLTALIIGPRQGILLFKEFSAYRLFNSSDGDYVTIDTEAGAASPLCVATLFGRVAVMNSEGIYVTDGLTELTPVADKLEPLFRPQELNLSLAGLMCAGTQRDRFVFSLPRSGAAANNLTIEYHPLVGWLVPHNFGASFFALVEGTVQATFQGAANSGLVYESFKSGTDDGAAIACRWQSAWYPLGQEYQVHIRRAIVSGRGLFNLIVRKDFETGAGETIAIDATEAGFYERRVTVFEIGIGRFFSFEIQETSSVSTTAPAVLDDGHAPEIGNVAFYGIKLDFVNLGPA